METMLVVVALVILAAVTVALVVRRKPRPGSDTTAGGTSVDRDDKGQDIMWNDPLSRGDDTTRRQDP
jgi:hypothetical protein